MWISEKLSPENKRKYLDHLANEAHNSIKIESKNRKTRYESLFVHFTKLIRISKKLNNASCRKITLKSGQLVQFLLEMRIRWKSGKSKPSDRKWMENARFEGREQSEWK